MNNLKKVTGSDEEEDLESLRLAALQSLKRKNEFAETSTYHYNQCLSPDKANHYRSLKGGGRNKRGRFFGPHQGRGGKSGHFNRVRNTNLISLTPVYDEINVQEKVSSNSGASLTLSQDKYSKASDEKIGEVEEGTSKFNRYNNSDKSESESDVEDISSEDEVTEGKLERADSLEALMQELDDEIQGKPKGKEDNQVTEDKQKTKKVKKKKRLVSDSDPKSVDHKADIEEPNKKPEVVEQEITGLKKVESEIKDTVDEPTPAMPVISSPTVSPQHKSVPEDVSPIRRRTRSRSPFNRRPFRNRPNHRNYPNHPPHLPPLHMQYGPPPNHFPQHMIPFPNQQFNPMFAPPGVIPPQMPMFFDRPLSPLAINTESLTNATLAPLSPRSAAFVLQNKAIIEKRRRSPRRSYSRSLSRSLSRSPRRSLTPPRRFPRRSISPRRSPRRMSPRRRSLSPNRRSLSPRRPKALKTDNSPVNRPRMRERPAAGKLGSSGNANRASKEKEPVPAKEEKPLDPVLEARKKKFESNEISRKGIIRLRPKDDKPAESAVEVPPVSKEKMEEPAHDKKEASKVPDKDLIKVPDKVPNKVPDKVPNKVPDKNHKVPDKDSSKVREKDPSKVSDKDPDEFKELEELLNEEALLDDDEILLDQKVEDIFSDDDFVSDTEGRFKVDQKDSEKVVSVPFSKLLNGAKDEIKFEALPDSQRCTRDRGSRSYNSRHSERRARARSPATRRETSRRETYRESKEKSIQKKTESQEKPQVKHRTLLRSEKPSPVMDRRFERKIEIKIKNPLKYQKSGKSRTAKKEEDKNHKIEKIDAVESEGEITVEVEDDDEVPKSVGVGNESGGEESSVANEGDLRAQLSRKRAEKLHKIPSEEVSSRLLQFALQGAVFKKSKKKSRDKSITSSDGKLPIHLRLGLGGHSDIFEDVKVKKKSRKRKNREVLEQM